MNIQNASWNSARKHYSNCAPIPRVLFKYPIKNEQISASISFSCNQFRILENVEKVIKLFKNFRLFDFCCLLKICLWLNRQSHTLYFHFQFFFLFRYYFLNCPNFWVSNQLTPEFCIFFLKISKIPEIPSFFWISS